MPSDKTIGGGDDAFNTFFKANSASFTGGRNENRQADWLFDEDVTALYGIRKSFLFRLVESGALKSILLKGRGQMRGIRLFRAEDIQALIDKADNNQQS
jgi:hypothetical protein